MRIALLTVLVNSLITIQAKGNPAMETEGFMAPLTSPYDPHLPSDIRDDVVTALLTIDVSDAALSRRPHATFASAESSVLSKDPVINRIHRFATPRFDVWLMRQSQGEKDGTDPAHWSFVAIIVDKLPADNGRPLSYYLEFSPKPVAKGALPIPIAHRVACLKCHANGPRAIRPMRGAGLPPLTPDALTMINDWNIDIANSGVVRNHQTTLGRATKIYASKAANAELTIPKCRQCHDPATGIRSELRRMHAGSISFLATHGNVGDGTTAKVAGAHVILPAHNRFMTGEAPIPAMPVEDGRLTRDEAACLTAWLGALDGSSACHPIAAASGDERAAPAMVSSPDATWILDNAASHLKAVVTTNVSTFTIEGLVPRGEVRCRSKPKTLCDVDVTVDLAQAASGVSLRDRHLKERLQVERFRHARAHATLLTWPALGVRASDTDMSLTLDIAGKAATIDTSLACSVEDSGGSIRCRIAPFRWNMRSHGIEPPKFLGLEVMPNVVIEGEIALVKGQGH